MINSDLISKLIWDLKFMDLSSLNFSNCKLYLFYKKNLSITLKGKIM